MSQDTPPYREALEGFRSRIEELGVPLTFDVRRLDGAASADGTLAGFAGDPGDVILALGSAATREVARRFSERPIISGLSLRRTDFGSAPNVTGVYLEFPVEVELQWMRKLLPRQKRIGVLFNSAENRDRVDRAGRVASSMDMELLARRIESPSQIPDSLESLTNEAEVLWGVADDVVLTPETAKAFILFSLRNRIPFVGLSAPWVKAGALYALDRDYADVGRQCADMAVRILHGDSTAAVPPAPPRSVVYAVNLRTAAQMKLSVPGELIRGAKEVVK